jgi:hypothetical protein
VHVVEYPEHPPDQPAKVEFESGVAVRVTVVPALKVVPVGLVVTVPVPVPVLEMVSVADAGRTVRVTKIVCGVFDAPDALIVIVAV